MAKQATPREITVATDSLRSLKSILDSTNRGSVGLGASEQARLLNTHLSSTSASIDILRADTWTPQAVAAVSEYDLCEKVCRDVLSNLEVGAQYQGERRGLMTISQKSAFIRQHGSEAYEKLPY